MNIETRDLKHVSVVKISGRVDSATAPDLQQALQGLIEANRRASCWTCTTPSI